MLKRLARYVAACTGVLAMFFGIGAAALAQVGVTIDGDETNFSPPPTVNAGRVFVPLRGVFERLGASVVYANGTINATKDRRNISLQIGSTQATVDGKPQTLDVAPYIVGASTYVPLRFVSQALGASVDYDDSDRLVSIDSHGGGRSYVGQANASQAYAYQSEYAPPPNPDYQQPPVPGANYTWQPGYWSWGQSGYYWVPGTWVAPPQQGYLWTPGYWQQNDGIFGFIQGFWAKTVGYYGGVNYGNGYNGNGYDGARWSGNQLQYNTDVTRVNPSSGYGTYAAPVAAIVGSMAHVSYNGKSGIQARPTTAQLSVAKAPHLGPTTAQVQHVATAATDRRLLAKVNHNVPPVLVVPKPLSAGNPMPARTAATPTGVVRTAPAAHAALVVQPTAAKAEPPAKTAPATMKAEPAAIKVEPAARAAQPAAKAELAKPASAVKPAPTATAKESKPAAPTPAPTPTKTP